MNAAAPCIDAIAIPFEIPLPDGRKVARQVWAFAVAGATPALIDTGVAGAWPRIAEAIGRQGHRPEELATVLFTHAHPDHVGSAASIARQAGATFAAAADATEWIQDPAVQNRQRPVPGFDALVEGGVAIGRTLTDGEWIDLGGAALEAIATPGHADGHLAFFCPQGGALFSGDAIPEPGAMPIYTDLPATLVSLRRLSQVSAEILYSSWEAPIAGRQAITERMDAARRWLEAVHRAVSEAAEEAGDLPGRTRATVARLGLPPFAANPLMAASVAAHLPWTHLADLASIEPGRTEARA